GAGQWWPPGSGDPLLVHTRGVFASLALDLDVVDLDEVVEIGSCDVEYPRGLRHVSVRPLERVPDHPGLALAHGLLGGQISIRCRRATRRAREDVLPLDPQGVLVLGALDGDPDSVLELAHVTRPLRGLDRAQGVS